MENADFIAIGDVVIDAFIRIQEARKVCNMNDGQCELCMAYGDKIPYEFAVEIPAVGNSANAAVAAARLGLKSGLIANIGNDQHGKECLAAFEKNKVMTDFIKLQEGKKTNYHYALWYGDDRTILIKHEEYEYKLPNIGKPKWLYLSSLAEHTLPFHKEIAEYLKSNPDVNLVFQPGTFQMKFGVEELSDIYQHSKIFFCNLEESQRILKTEEKDILKLLQGIKALGPELVVITDGPKGAYAYTENTAVHIPEYPDPKPPYERTGAGDAFASTFTTAIILGKTLEDALKWASINSMSVTQYVGAQEGLLDQAKIEEYLAKAPPDWRATRIN